MNEHSFVLRGEYVELHVLLKLLAIADSGGAAKAMVADRLVRVDGQIETRKARKLRAGSRVEVAGQTITVLAP
ncbi:RNA-binding S4 domain-containing protein [Niveibacterium terrae]|uniref:RNA-binding S4 domain-containing protein n=1 Tax=Niveibacterium terrae TaxID=3373598 RepID=UPI003A941EC9